MGGAVALPLVVEVAFGAEPLDTGVLTWTDISDYVRRGTGIDFNRGWDTETDEPIAGRLTFTLNNDSGDFTPGETGTYGEIRNRLPVRVSRSGVGVLWTGLVESWRQSWENGVRSQVAVTCVDRWAAIRRIKIDQDRLDAAARVTGRSVHYKFRDTGTASFVDSLGVGLPFQPNGTSSLRPATIPDPTGDPSLPNVLGMTALGQRLDAPIGSDHEFSLDDGLSMTLIMKASGFNDTAEYVHIDLRSPGSLTTNHAYVEMTYNGTGKLDADARLSTPGGGLFAHSVRTVLQDVWQAVTVTYKRTGGTTTTKMYVSGSQVATDSDVTDDLASPQTVRIDPDYDSPHTLAIGGFIMHHKELTADEVALIARQVATWAGDTPDTRANRLKDFGPTSLTTTGTFSATMSMQDLGDKSLADALMECATAEDGTIYMSTAGWPVLTSRSWRVGNSVAFTVPAKALSTDVSFTLDDQQLINSATVDRMVRDETAGTVKATADASITTYGEQNKSLQVWLDTDVQHLERANAEANQWSNPLVRSSDLTVDILTKNATIPAATMLGADIGQRIAVSGMPSEAPGATQFFIESISDRVTTTGWERTFTVSPRLDYFTIENATFGVIDADNVLAF